MKRLLIIKAGTTFTSLASRLGDFDTWVINHMYYAGDIISVVDGCSGCELPDSRRYGGIIVTGSHSMVTDGEPWSEQLAAWIHQAVTQEIPLLGICYGHQLLAYAMGGTVGYHTGGMEIGTVRIELNSAGIHDPLLGTLPASFYAHVCHSQTVLQLPESATVLASNAFDPHHAFAVGTCAWGVQFHPEFDAEIVSEYIKEMASDLEKMGIQAVSCYAGVRQTLRSNQLLEAFFNFCKQRDNEKGTDWKFSSDRCPEVSV